MATKPLFLGRREQLLTVDLGSNLRVSPLWSLEEDDRKCGVRGKVRLFNTNSPCSCFPVCSSCCCGFLSCGQRGRSFRQQLIAVAEALGAAGDLLFTCSDASAADASALPEAPAASSPSAETLGICRSQRSWRAAAKPQVSFQSKCPDFSVKGVI